MGETKDNTTEPRRYARDYWKGVTPASYAATAWFPARVAVTAPDDYTSNSVGVCVRDTVANGLRTQVWETDHPVKILNIVCGRWKVRQGEGTTIFYSAAHPYNIDEMSATLDASRKWYSEWFLPYPWRELKLSEFPALASYAQGFGTNITFSENIGFLTKNHAKTDPTFLVTAQATNSTGDSPSVPGCQASGRRARLSPGRSSTGRASLPTSPVSPRPKSVCAPEAQGPPRTIPAARLSDRVGGDRLPGLRGLSLGHGKA